MAAADVTNRYLAMALVGFAAFVAWLAVPAILDSLIAQGSIDTIAALRRYEPVPDDQVREALEALGPASETSTGDRLIDQGILSLILAERLDEADRERNQLLIQAKRLAQARLERAPGDVHSWARLSYAEYLLNGPSELVIEALGQSHERGPFEYYVLWPRLRLGVLLWPFLDEEMRNRTMAQAVTVLRTDGGAYRLARFYFKISGEMQGELLRRVEGAEGQEVFQRFLARETERRQGA